MRRTQWPRSSSSWLDWRLAVAVAWMILASYVQAMYPNWIPLGFIWAAVLLVATFAAPPVVAVLSAIAVLLTLLSGWASETTSDAGFWVRLAVWVLVAAAAYALAEQRADRDRRMAEMASTDPLTGLANRRLLLERFSAQLELRGRTEKAAVICLDLDRFKAVNDTLGHPIGDLVLTAESNRMLGCVRAEDTVARIGGDEFVISCPSVDGRDGLDALCTRLTEVLSAPIATPRGSVHVGVTIGAVLIASHQGLAVEALLAAADDVLIARKADRPGGYEIVEATEPSQPPQL